MKKSFFFLIILIFTVPAFANTGKSITKQEYISKWNNIAVQQMIEYNIPASITLAQAILESASGNSDLARNGNNHFGIKCHDWTGEKMYKDDDTKNECFRVYRNAEESFVDHSLFLAKRQRYAKLFTYELTDYKSWAKGLKEAGYATNPKYPDLLIDLIESMDLDEFDKLGNTSLHSISDLTKEKETKEKAEVELNPKTQSKSKNKKSIKSKKSKRILRKEEKEKKESNEFALNVTATHSVYTHTNKVKYVVTKKGDTYFQIAQEFGLNLNQLYNYNDFESTKDILEVGDIVHIQPKRARAKDKAKKYTSDKTIYQVAQEEGVNLKSLMNKNEATESTVFSKGEKVVLR